jgi:hypothetical protein
LSVARGVPGWHQRLLGDLSHAERGARLGEGTGEGDPEFLRCLKAAGGIFFKRGQNHPVQFG